MTYSKVARTYAESLYLFAKEQNALQAVQEDVTETLGIINAHAELRRTLENPIIKQSAKFAILKQILESKVSAQYMRFLDVFFQRFRIDSIKEIAEAFIAFSDKQQGNIRVTIESAREMTTEQLAAIKSNLERQLQGNVFFDSKINASLLGGFVIKYNDVVVDASLSHKLYNLKKKILNTGLTS
jgi:F-type H+-transporting ATPase subunit delta